MTSARKAKLWNANWQPPKKHSWPAHNPGKSPKREEPGREIQALREENEQLQRKLRELSEQLERGGK
ncbi:MAG UNVERIFIED_CONTAM: hypothetical protein LVR18_19055 [Planctomycetaceae bacterium]